MKRSRRSCTACSMAFRGKPMGLGSRCRAAGLQASSSGPAQNVSQAVQSFNLHGLALTLQGPSAVLLSPEALEVECCPVGLSRVRQKSPGAALLPQTGLLFERGLCFEQTVRVRQAVRNLASQADCVVLKSWTTPNVAQTHHPYSVVRRHQLCLSFSDTDHLLAALCRLSGAESQKPKSWQFSAIAMCSSS